MHQGGSHSSSISYMVNLAHHPTYVWVTVWVSKREIEVATTNIRFQNYSALHVHCRPCSSTWHAKSEQEEERMVVVVVNVVVIVCYNGGGGVSGNSICSSSRHRHGYFNHYHRDM